MYFNLIIIAAIIKKILNHFNQFDAFVRLLVKIINKKDCSLEPFKMQP